MSKASNVKITILGESTTGKTAIAYRLVRNEFTEKTESTIGASFLTLIDNNVKFEIWDTAGQERYLALVPMYYRGADVILLVFDLSRLETIERLLHYLEKISKDLTNYKILIIGNKLDLIDPTDLPRIDKQLKTKLENYKYLFKIIDFINISTKTGENFDLFVHKFKLAGHTQAENKMNKIPNVIILHDTTPKFGSIADTMTTTITDTLTTTASNAYDSCSC